MPGLLLEDLLGGSRELTLRVHVPNNWVLQMWVMVITVLVLGKYMIIGYLTLRVSK